MLVLVGVDNSGVVAFPGVNNRGVVGIGFPGVNNTTGAGAILDFSCTYLCLLASFILLRFCEDMFALSSLFFTLLYSLRFSCLSVSDLVNDFVGLT